MILDEITLCDFGVFRGQQSARIAPPSSKQPITLVGGLNGAGKTTLLEALQLALYGRHAPFLGTARGYDDYLARSIHRHAEPADGASVGLVFRANEDGQVRAYHVERAWRRTNGRVDEEVTVRVDGRHDSVLAETWFEHAERFIPARLSPLFFFDGERIEALADASRSSEVLETAIHALLGVDLVEQLRIDLQVLAQRKQKEVKPRADRDRIIALERELQAHQDGISRLRQEHAHYQNERDRADKRLKQLESRFAAQGGRLGDERRELEQKQIKVEAELKAARAQLVQVATGTLPIRLYFEGLRRVVEQADLELSAKRSAVLAEIAGERDARLLEHLKAAGTESGILRTAERFLRAERMRLKDQSQCESFLDLGAEDVQRARDLLRSGLEQQCAQANELLAQVRKLEATEDELGRALASIPDEEAIADLLKELQAARGVLAERERKLFELGQAGDQAKAERDRAETELQRLLRSGRERDFENRDIERHLRHSERVRESLEQFRVALIARHTARLQDLILDGYLQLLRKRSLVNRIEIDPETCALRLSNGTGQAIPDDRLSAGERQLLAVAMLWGLAKASGRPLPTVIDTPLGRLDATHRKHLVERYFPRASHQVILLSTDEEIDEQYLKELRGRVGHAYRLEYDDETGGSAIRPGYFWQV